MKASPWPPAIVLSVGALLATVGVRAQRSLALRQPLATAVPMSVQGFRGRDLELSAAEIEVTGVTTYLSRAFEQSDSTAAGVPWFLVYVGYYDRQASGKTIHSPKNCLPGSGWEPLRNELALVPTATGPVTVNRYLIQNQQHHQALVLYWYQGRGRVVANEYLVKWNLVRDAALRRRSEEALVRIVVPVPQRGTEAESVAEALRVAEQLVPAVRAALPAA